MRNLKGREVVIGIFDYKPFMLLDYERKPFFYDRSENTTEVAIDGTEIRLMLTFCELYNCTIQVDTSEKTDWGDIYPNGSGYGLVGMVLDRRNDYGVGGMYLWYEAYQYMDMTHFLGRSGVTCLVPAPNRLISWTLLLRPFQTALWMCVMLCLLLESLALCVTRRWEHYADSPFNSWMDSLRFGCISTLKLFVSQGTSYVTSSYALRTVLVASYMIDIILTTVYSGGLAAILTLPTLEEAADSRQRLFDHKLIWTGTSQAWITTIDERSADPVLLGLMEHYRVYDASLISAYSHTEQMGFVVERMQFGHLGNTELIENDALERLKLMVDDIYFAFTVAFVPRLWPHLNAYNDFILAWHSSGLDKFWEWKIAADYMNAHRQNRIVASQRPNLDIGPVQLGIDNFIGLILLWCFGMICSLLTFAIELWKGQEQSVL
ncbi:ionotropic receptor 25a isoform X2 [Drosophila suzukii]